MGHQARHEKRHGSARPARAHAEALPENAQARNPRPARRRLRLPIQPDRHERARPAMVRRAPRLHAGRGAGRRHQARRRTHGPWRQAGADQGGLPRRPAGGGRGPCARRENTPGCLAARADHERRQGPQAHFENMNKLWSALAAGLTLAAAVAAFPALAQSYPSRPIRLVAPFPPGGSIDVVGRLLAAKLSDSLGQQIVVDNRSGASGIIGTEVVMNSPPDGYTLLINTIPFVTNQFLMPRVPYDALRDFVQISLVASAPSFVTVHPSVPVRSIQELIALAKSKPGQLNYSSAGVGTNPHIAGELFNLLAGVDIVAVQYKGGGPADTAIIAGEVAVTFGNVSQQTAHVKSGPLPALAGPSAERLAPLPQLPTVAEAGVPGYEFQTLVGV